MQEYFRELLFVGIHNPELLEGLQGAWGGGAYLELLHAGAYLLLGWQSGTFWHAGCAANAPWPRRLKKVNLIGINNSMTFALDFEVIGDDLYL